MSRKIIITENTLKEYEQKLVETNRTENVIDIDVFRDTVTFGAVVEVEA
ncbi:hypothetical protein [Cetobacterium sp.]